jgi:hypothetical protein
MMRNVGHKIVTQKIIAIDDINYAEYCSDFTDTEYVMQNVIAKIQEKEAQGPLCSPESYPPISNVSH